MELLAVCCRHPREASTPGGGQGQVLTEAVSYLGKHQGGVLGVMLDPAGQLTDVETLFATGDVGPGGFDQINIQIRANVAAVRHSTSGGLNTASAASVSLGPEPFGFLLGGFNLPLMTIPSRAPSIPATVQSVDSDGRLVRFLIESDSYDCGGVGPGLRAVRLTRQGDAGQSLPPLVECFDPTIGLPRRIVFRPDDVANIVATP